MFLMFNLGRPDVMPADDLGVQNAIRRHYKMRQRPESQAPAEARRAMASVPNRGSMVPVAQPRHRTARRQRKGADKEPRKEEEVVVGLIRCPAVSRISAGLGSCSPTAERSQCKCPGWDETRSDRPGCRLECYDVRAEPEGRTEAIRNRRRRLAWSYARCRR